MPKTTLNHANMLQVAKFDAASHAYFARVDCSAIMKQDRAIGAWKQSFDRRTELLNGSSRLLKR